MSKSAAEKAELLEKVAAAKGDEWVDLVSTPEDLGLIHVGMRQRLEVGAEELKRSIAGMFHVDIQHVERLVALVAENIPDPPEAPFMDDAEKNFIALVALTQQPERLAKMLASLPPDQPRAGSQSREKPDLAS